VLLSPGIVAGCCAWNQTALLGQLHHPNVVHMYGVTYQHPHAYIVTELCDGSLLQLMRAPGDAPPLRTRVQLALQVAYGMEYLHSKGIVHRCGGACAGRGLLWARSMCPHSRPHRRAPSTVGVVHCRHSFLQQRHVCKCHGNCVHTVVTTHPPCTATEHTHTHVQRPEAWQRAGGQQPRSHGGQDMRLWPGPVLPPHGHDGLHRNAAVHGAVRSEPAPTPHPPLSLFLSHLGYPLCSLSVSNWALYGGSSLLQTGEVGLGPIGAWVGCCEVLCRELMLGSRVQYSAKVDVYSFGMLLSELLTWVPCYSASTLPVAEGGVSDSVDRMAFGAGACACALGSAPRRAPQPFAGPLGTPTLSRCGCSLCTYLKETRTQRSMPLWPGRPHHTRTRASTRSPQVVITIA
jgi:hypothetical protein